jgi:hypothetical protein
MSATDDKFLKTLYQNLSDAPLTPDSPFYEPIDAISGPHVKRLEKHIILNPVESVQFFSGFRGSGKTTELFRLQNKLEEKGYFVVYADALNYLNPAGPIDISDLLLMLAGAFSDGLIGRIDAKLAEESYWDRFRNFLTKTQVKFSAFDMKFSDPTKMIGLDIKANLKENPTFRHQFQEALGQHIVALKNDANKFFEDCVKAIRKERGDDVQIVFIFDSLEQLRGSFFNEERVIKSVVSLFENHQSKLAIPYVHTIYTVPPWLKFALPGAIANPMSIIPSIRQWENDVGRTSYDQGSKALLSLVRRRFAPDGIKKVFGDESRVERLIAVCGGHFRDLLRMLREVLLQAESFPVSDTILKRAILEVRKQYLPISVSDARWLDRIAKKRRPDQDGDGDAGRLARFLDSHLVLYLLNGEEWYDVHPLIRDEVEKIVADNPLQPPVASASDAANQ